MTMALGFAAGVLLFALGYRLIDGHWPWQWP